MENRLQFRHHGIGSGYTVAEGVFETREAAIEYITTAIRNTDDGLAATDPSHGFSLYAEPTVLRYKNEENEEDPHVIFCIGSYTNTTGRYSKNKFCIIDIDKTESEIEELAEELEKAIRMLSIVAYSSDTINMYAEKTDEGTILSGDVRIAEANLFDGELLYKENKIITVKDGIFLYVDLEFDDATDTFTFRVNDTEKSFSIQNNNVVAGYYSPNDESLHLVMKHGDDVVIDLEKLIAEWVVEGEAANSPIVLKREEVGYGISGSTHHHVEPWQDVLSADVRLATDRVNNILKKSDDNRYLYVDGLASNIVYYSPSGKTNVQDALSNLDGIKISNDSTNIITNKADGFFASSKLEYITNENTLVFTTSTNEPGERKKETRIKLNTFKLFENIYYDSAKEELVISYFDGTGELKYVRIPIGEMMQDWEWDVSNYGHNVFLQKERKTQGSDQLSADVVLSKAEDNILEDQNHQLYVKGTASNIKYGRNSNVEDEIYNIKESANTLSSKVDNISDTLDDTVERLSNEISRATIEESRIDGKLDNEISRSTNMDAALDNKINLEISRAKEAENALGSKIDAISADTASSLKDIINEDHSIAIAKNDATRPVVSVNLSNEVEDNKPNIIKLNTDGLYAGVDLEYVFNEQVGTNQLIFKTTNGTKTFDLKTNSIVDKIYYDASREAIIIEYTVNGQRMPDVVIPVGDLINEWRVQDGHDGAIQLEKVRESGGTQDVLKASVVISQAHADNILLNDNGALYVSGKGITDNAEAIDALGARMSDAESEISNVKEGLREEISARTLADESLSSSIEAEESRAEAVEARLREDLDGEITRSTETDAELEASIASEVSRSTAKDQELETSISNEVIRATSAETALQASIDAERARAEAAEAGLNNTIDEVYNKVEDDIENSWKVQQGEHLGAIILKKEKVGSDTAYTLSAESVISSLEDNMLINDMGALYVSSKPVDDLKEDVDELREEFEGSLGTEDTNTLHLERDRSNNLKGNVKLASAEDGNLIKETDNGIMFSGDIDCGEYI